MQRSERPSASDGLRRIAMVSLHTSPLDQPGVGDAGGMNVYVTEVARELAARGVEVDIFTRATSSDLEPAVTLTDGVVVRHVSAGPYVGLSKEELPAQLCAFAREVLRDDVEAGPYDLVHSHYWLSGHVGALARDRWGVPLVHTMHTMAKVKNELMADGDEPEPHVRVIGEEQVVAAADMLVANTDDEAKDLINFYDADPGRVEVVNPGVDLAVFSPRDRAESRRRLGLPVEGNLVVFVGRIQPLKAPDLVLRAAHELEGRGIPLRVAVVGGQSGAGHYGADALAGLAADLGIRDSVEFVEPAERDALVDWYAAADVVCVPSYNESFGLVALEAQAVGTPVVAAAVGGLTTVVRHDVSGLLVEGHAPTAYADAIGAVLCSPEKSARFSAAAIVQAGEFPWSRTAERLMNVYREAMRLRAAEQ